MWPKFLETVRRAYFSEHNPRGEGLVPGGTPYSTCPHARPALRRLAFLWWQRICRRSSALAEEVGVELGLGLAEGLVGCALVKVLLPVAAGGALHDVDSFEVEVAAVGIDGVVRQPDAIDHIHVAEGLLFPPALQAEEPGQRVSHRRNPLGNRPPHLRLPPQGERSGG